MKKSEVLQLLDEGYIENQNFVLYHANDMIFSVRDTTRKTSTTEFIHKTNYDEIRKLSETHDIYLNIGRHVQSRDADQGELYNYMQLPRSLWYPVTALKWFYYSDSFIDALPCFIINENTNSQESTPDELESFIISMADDISFCATYKDSPFTSHDVNRLKLYGTYHKIVLILKYDHRNKFHNHLKSLLRLLPEEADKHYSQ